jgi:hypothetical protein
MGYVCCLLETIRNQQRPAVYLLIDLMQFRLDNTGGHISHLAGAFFGFSFIQLLQKNDLSEIVTGVITFFTNLFKNRAHTI